MTKIYMFTKTSRLAVRPTQPPIQQVPLPSGIKLVSGNVKYEWSYISSDPYAFMACSGPNLTFFFCRDRFLDLGNSRTDGPRCLSMEGGRGREGGGRGTEGERERERDSTEGNANAELCKSIWKTISQCSELSTERGGYNFLQFLYKGFTVFIIWPLAM
jgi:hypothetical protein